MKVIRRIFEILKFRIKKLKDPFASYRIIVGLFDENKRLKLAVKAYAENNANLVRENIRLKNQIKEYRTCEKSVN